MPLIFCVSSCLYLGVQSIMGSIDDEIQVNKDRQRMMVDPMFMIVQIVMSFLTAVATTAVAPIAVIVLYLPEFTWIYLNLPEFTSIYLNLPQFTQVYMNWPKISWIFRNLPEFTWIYLNIAEFTCIYLHLPNFTWIFLNLPEFT